MKTTAEEHQVCQWPEVHDWEEDYYGYKCKHCGAFIAYGCEPWCPENYDAAYEGNDE